MKKTLITYLFFVAFTMLLAQENLVLNPSFESYTACPGTSSDVDRAVGWYNAKNSPDYFNECATNNTFKVPHNFCGYQIPANGKAYCGLATYNSNINNYRELIIGTLTSPLVVGQKYFFSFKANKADSEYVFRHSTNNLGIRFTQTKYNLGNPDLSSVLTDNFAHFNNSNVILDTLNWIKSKGSFVADSAYKYLMLGNFFDTSNTNLIDFGSGLGTAAYYYIDEVCVTTDSLYNEGYTTTSFSKQKFAKPSSSFPNPFNDFLNLSIEEDSEVKIYDISGLLIFSKAIANGQTEIINTSNWLQGVYILNINKNQNKLIIKCK